MNFNWIKTLCKGGLSVVSFLLALSCGKRGTNVSVVDTNLNDRSLPFTKEEILILKRGAIVNKAILLTEEDMKDFRNTDKLFYLTQKEIDIFNEKNGYEPLAHAGNDIFVCDYEYETSYGGSCKNIGNVFLKECTKVMVKNCITSNGSKSAHKVYKKIVRASLDTCPACLMN